MTAYWNFTDQALVVDDAAPVVWTDEDVSAYTGADTVWCLLALTATDGAGNVAFRPDGDADEWLCATADMSNGCCCVSVDSTDGTTCMVMVQTDSSGVFEWCSSAALDCDLVLVGYVSDVDDTFLGLWDGPLPNGWTALDANAVIEERAVCMLKDSQNANMGDPGLHVFRPCGDAGDWELDDNGDICSAAKGDELLINETFGAMTFASTDESAGQIDVYSYTG